MRTIGRKHPKATRKRTALYYRIIYEGTIDSLEEFFEDGVDTNDLHIIAYLDGKEDFTENDVEALFEDSANDLGVEPAGLIDEWGLIGESQLPEFEISLRPFDAQDIL